MSELRKLMISRNNNDLSPLASLTELQGLYLYDNAADLTPIEPLIETIKSKGGVVKVSNTITPKNQK